MHVKSPIWPKLHTHTSIKNFSLLHFMREKKENETFIFDFYRYNLERTKRQRKVLSYKSNKKVTSTTHYYTNTHSDKRNENLNSSAAAAAYVSLMTYFALSISILFFFHMRRSIFFSRIHLEILTRAFRNSFSFSFTPVCP